MSDSIKICAIGVICAIACILLKNIRQEFLIPTRLAGIVLIFSILFIVINPLLEYLNTLFSYSLPLEDFKILLKVLGIAYITQISSEICRESGENSIAVGIESAGKIEIIILSIPLINNLIELSKELILW